MNDSMDDPLCQLAAEVEQRGLGNATWAEQIVQLEEHIDVMATAATHGALRRRREVRSAGDLLRIVLVYAACDWSLRQLALWCVVLGVADCSRTALRKRLRQCGAWLTALVGALLRVPRGPQGAVRVRLLDTTTVTAPGEKGHSWRVHMAWDLATLQISDVTLTPTGQNDAELLGRFPLRRDEIVIADQGFSYAASLAPLLQGGYPCVVRSNWRSIRLEDAGGQPVNVVALMRTLAPRQCLERPVWVCHAGARYPMRLIIVGLPQASADRARQRIRDRLRKRGKTPTAETLLTAGCTLLLTNLPLVDWPAERLLELYRWRWHIEVYFKRLKSVLQLDHLRAKDLELARVYLLAKLLIALLVDGWVREVRAARPDWFQGLARPICLTALTQLFLSGLQHQLIGYFTLHHILQALPRLARFLLHSPRHRTSLLARALDRLSCLLPITAIWQLPLS